MAILLDFRKIRDDRHEVEYVFGPPETMDRRLVIQKATREGRPLDGNEDRDYWAVFVKIRRIYEKQTRWPKQGAYAA